MTTRQHKIQTELGRAAVRIFAANERMNQMLPVVQQTQQRAPATDVDVVTMRADAQDLQALARRKSG